MEVTCKSPDGTTLLREVTCQIPDTTSALDWITALGTAGAVVIASIAVVMTQRSMSKERRHQRLVERHRAAVELLEAFEAKREHGSDDYYGAPVAQPPELRDARARFQARLRASEEPLPLNRWTTYGEGNSQEDKVIEHLIALRELPDGYAGGITGPTRADVHRNEIVAVIDDLRDQINSN